MSGFFGRPAPPTPPPPQPIPDLADPAVLDRKRRVLEAAMTRSGRASTDMTSSDTYGSDKLGLR